MYRLRPLAQKLCGEMADAVTGNKPGPKLPVVEWAQLLIKRSADRGLRPRNLVPLNNYLERCLNRRVLPQCNNVLRTLLPRAAQRGLIPRSIEAVPF